MERQHDVRAVVPPVVPTGGTLAVPSSFRGTVTSTRRNGTTEESALTGSKPPVVMQIEERAISSVGQSACSTRRRSEVQVLYRPVLASLRDAKTCYRATTAPSSTNSPTPYRKYQGRVKLAARQFQRRLHPIATRSLSKISLSTGFSRRGPAITIHLILLSFQDDTKSDILPACHDNVHPIR